MSDFQKQIEEIKAQYSANYQASRALNSNIAIPAPQSLSYLPYQRAGIAYCAKNNGVLLADEPGLGKTIQAIGLINLDLTIAKILIICPASLKKNWLQECHKWLTRKLTVTIAQGVFPPTDIIIVNYDVIERYIDAIHTRKFDLIIVDEAHNLRNGDSVKASFILGNEEKNIPSIQARKKLFLTGTPIVNRPAELWPILHYLNPEAWASWDRFALRFCQHEVTMEKKTQKKNSGASDLENLQKLMRASLMVRRMKRDVLSQLPRKLRRVFRVSDEKARLFVQEEREVYEKQLKNIATLKAAVLVAREYKEKDLETYERAIKQFKEGRRLAMSEYSRMRHNAALLKLPHVIKHINQILAENPQKKLIIFAHHADVMDHLMQVYGKRAVRVQGSTPNKERQTNVKRFQEDPSCQFFIGSILASGTGFTLTASHHVVFAEMTYVSADLEQAGDRCIVKNSLVSCLLPVHNNEMGMMKIQDIKVGDMVLTHTGTYKRVTAINSHVHRGMTTTLQYVGWDVPLECTFDHKIMVRRNNENIWLPAHQILPTDSMVFPKNKTYQEMSMIKIKDEWRLHKKINKQSHCSIEGCDKKVEARGKCRLHYRQEIASPNRPPKSKQTNIPCYVSLPDTIQVNNDWLYLFGWYAAEGFSSLLPGKSKFVSCCGHKKELFVLEKLQKLFNSIGVNCSIFHNKKSGVELRAYSSELALWFRDWFGHGAENKKLPNEILNLPPEQAAEFLRGYTDGDGYQRKNQVEWVSASQILCYQIALLSIRAGFIPTMRTVIHPKTKKEHFVGSYTKFGNPDNKRLNEQDDNFIYRPVSRVETKNDKKRVFDLTVEEDHSFTVGFSTVHNCHRIGQTKDVTIDHILLDESIEVRMAQIILEKQRIADEALDYKIAA